MNIFFSRSHDGDCPPKASGQLAYASLVAFAALAVTTLAACASEPEAAVPAHAGHADVRPPRQGPLPSWTDGGSKTAILELVARVTDPAGADFVPVDQRIATFDNDGTLWSEQPFPAEFAFTLDRVKALAPQHPEWKSMQPFKGVLEGNASAVAESGERGLMDLIAATHAGNTTEEFEHIVGAWIALARHPRFDRPYTDLVYQPMLEVLAYLRANGFKTFIVSGGGAEFIRTWADRVYGIPPEQVIGSRAKVVYEVRGGVPVLLRLPGVDLVDDKAGKPVGIQQQIGQRPIVAFGNSDGDLEMLEWTTSAPGLRWGFIVHHTDAEREWAYDRQSRVGRLARGLDEATKRGWVVVDMKQDWKVIYPFQK